MPLTCGAAHTPKPTRLSKATSSLDVEARAWQTLGTARVAPGNGPVPLGDGEAWPAHSPSVNPTSPQALTSARITVTDMGTSHTDLGSNLASAA